MNEDGRWVTINGNKIFIRTKNARLKEKVKEKVFNEKPKKEREQVSLTYAKQRFKNNINKYGFSTAFEDAILNFNLQSNEISSLYEYAKKQPDYNRENVWQLDKKYEEYKEGIKPYQW